MSVSDETILVCHRVSDLDQPIIGATITYCHDCVRDVWIAPTGVEFVAANPLAKTLCMRCVMRRIERGETVDGWRIPPGAFKELREHGMPEELIAAIEALMMVQNTRRTERQGRRH